MKYEIDYIEKIAKIVTDNNLSEITLEDGEQAIVVRKESSVITTATAPAPAIVAQPSSTPALNTAVQEKVEKPASTGTPITSPMVGAFYAAPAPVAKPFVKVGDVVSAGQVVFIVEAMKLMNEIESEVSGKITQICVEDGQSVEFGQVLMYVE